MSIGFSDGVAQRVPDRGIQRKTTPRVLLASFGDGYEQRTPYGINSLQEEYSVTFKTRLKAEIDDISDFFDLNKGVTSFTWTFSDTNSGGEKSIKVVCPEYNKVWEYDDYYTISAVFRRVYDA